MNRKKPMKYLIIKICFGTLTVFILYFVGFYLMYGVSQKNAVAKVFSIENMEGVEVVKYKYKYEKLNECYIAELNVGDKDFERFQKSIRGNETNGELSSEEFKLVQKEVADLRWYDTNSAADIYKYRYKPEYGYIYPFYNIRQYNIFAPQKRTAYAVMYVSESTNGQCHIYLEAFA